MDLYIDRENLISFMRSSKRPEFGDCIRMMMRQLRVHYNISKDALREEPLCQWYTLMTEGRGNSESVDLFSSVCFPERPISSSSYTSWNIKKISSVYLINDSGVSELKEKGCVLIGYVGEELDILSKLFCGNDYDFHKLYDLQKNFHSWDQLTDDNQIMPCTDILINDRYLFKNQQEIVTHNLKQLFTALSTNVKTQINIVIFTKKDGMDSFGKDKAKRIVRDIWKNRKEPKPNVTFVYSSDNDLIPHDRFIITNYRLIRSGDSFNYFNTEGERISNGGSLDIDSLADHNVHDFVESLVDKLQTSYREITRINKDCIYGDKKSRFIEF